MSDQTLNEGERDGVAGVSVEGEEAGRGEEEGAIGGEDIMVCIFIYIVSRMIQI